MKSRMATLLALGLIMVSGIGCTSNAQAVRNAGERAEDHRQIATDKLAIADDRADVDRLSDLIIEWDMHRKAGNDAALRAVQAEITVELRRDLAESSVQANKADAEVRKDSREVRSDRREIRKNQVTGEPGYVRRDDRRDLRDDRRDRRDDIRDAAQVEAILNEKREIARDLRALQHEIDKGLISESAGQNRQEALLNRYLDLSQKEIALGVRELREDHRELREDRRETREDRRQN